jgi:hypothetical protein
LDGPGASALFYELFDVVGNHVELVHLTGTDSKSELAGGDAALHGEGISCRVAPGNRLVVTQTTWEVSSPVYATSAKPISWIDTHQEVVVSYTCWVLGGNPLRQLSRRKLPERTTTYSRAQALGHVRC